MPGERDRAGAAGAGRKAYFGYRQVEAGEKGRLVRDVFASVAPRYDLMNDLMSGGVHRLWKAALIARLGLRPGMHLVDVAGGTGDIALGVLRRAPEGVRVTVCDVSPAMLEVGRERAIDRGLLDRIDWLCGDAEALPLASRSADAYTIAFGLRNVTDIAAALKEARRVLRPGGRFLCLEFGRVTVPPLRALYDRYSFSVIPRLGEMVAGDGAAYAYLVESIRRFPPQAELARMIDAAGLERVRVHNLSGGIAAIHAAWRL
ncbi:MAG: class I SAM-dependent methyltransferase [Kiloniellales bacterium]